MANELSSKAQQLLKSHGAFFLGRSAFEIFMSIFIWRLTNDIKVVAMFNILYASTHTLVFAIFAESFRKGQFNIVRKIGLVGFSIVYLVIAFLDTNFINYTYIFAVFIGLFNGMYWLPYHIYRFDATNIRNRGNYYGIERSVMTFVKLVAPVAGGFIISSNYFFSGYTSLFLISTVFFVVAFFLGNISIKSQIIPKKPWYESVRYILSHPKILRIFVAEMLNGLSMNGSLIGIILPLLILQKTGTEFQMGGWLSFIAVLSIITSAVVGKYLNYRSYDKAAILGGIIFTLSFALLYSYPNLMVFVIFGGLKELSSILMLIPRRVYSENLLHKVKDYQENRIGYLVTREVFNIGIGMVGSYILLLFAGDISFESLGFYSLIIVVAVLVQVYLTVSVRYGEEAFDDVK